MLSKALLDQFLSKENPDDLISLYCFYYYTAKWQKTNQPKATDSFCMSGLHWGYEKFKKAKSKLIEMGLIEKIQSREKGMITAWYVKVNFIWTASKINQSNQNYENPELGFQK